MRVIAFVGLPLSGKTTASKVDEEMGIPVVCMGDVVREEAKRRNLPLTDEVLGKIANELREREGMDAIAKRCIPLIREKGKDVGVVVVDGVRGIAEVETFKKAFGDDFILIAIEAPLEVRFQRALKRKRSDDVKSIEELKERDKRELSWNLGEAMKIANFTIENTSGLEAFKEKVRDILTQLARKVEIEIETDVHPTEDVDKVIQAVKNLYAALSEIDYLSFKDEKPANNEARKEFIDRFKAAMEDDFNTAKAIAVLFEISKAVKKRL